MWPDSGLLATRIPMPSGLAEPGLTLIYAEARSAVAVMISAPWLAVGEPDRRAVRWHALKARRDVCPVHIRPLAKTLDCMGKGHCPLDAYTEASPLEMGEQWRRLAARGRYGARGHREGKSPLPGLLAPRQTHHETGPEASMQVSIAMASDNRCPRRRECCSMGGGPK
jgi:hypothetical protein